MKDTIYREDAIRAINVGVTWYQVTCNDKQIAVMLMAKDVNEILEEVPSADRPQGKWITYYPPMSDMQKSMCGVKEKGYVPDKRFGRSKCSLCGCRRPMYEDSYCPNCGAYMKGADDEVL